MKTLKEVCTAALPKGSKCQYNYIQSRSRPCEPLFSPLPGHEPEPTRLAYHFLGFSLLNSAQEIPLLFLGLEVSVYTTRRLTTIFVSKADSTGLVPAENRIPTRALCTAFLKWLAEDHIRRHPRRKLVISLFARSQSQYLFPGSAENAGKHVLDDRALIKWWAKVLDPIVAPQPDDTTRTAFMTIPGYSAHELRSYFPTPGWKAGDPLKDIATTRGIPADSPPRCLLPRFEDDPKARFMSDLDEEMGLLDGPTPHTSPTKKRTGRWKTIADLERFWEAMEFRQECSSGRVVGFLWVVLESPLQEDGAGPREGSPTPAATASPRKPKSKPLTGVIIPRQPRLKGGRSSTLDLQSADNGVVVTREGYDATMKTLLHLDFAKHNVAEQSTRKWLEAGASVCGSKTWGVVVEGEAQRIETSTPGAQQVNDLGGMVIKKKRKIEEEAPKVNDLGAGLIKKKPKTANT